MQEMTEKNQEMSVEDENQRMQGDPSAELRTVQAWRADMQRHVYPLTSPNRSVAPPLVSDEGSTLRAFSTGHPNMCTGGPGPKAQLAFQSGFQLVRSQVLKTTTKPS